MHTYNSPPAETRLDWTAGALAEGLTCYRRGEFFTAHEHWEAVWLTLREPEKSFLQAIIQITAALHHRQQGRPRGAASLLTKALRRLEIAPADFGGLAVEPLRAAARALLHSFPDGSCRPLPLPIQPLSPSSAPQSLKK